MPIPCLILIRRTLHIIYFLEALKFSYYLFQAVTDTINVHTGYHSGFPKVEALGSFVMDIFTPKSDLDLSVNFNADETSSFPRKKKVSILRKLAQIFYAQECNSPFLSLIVHFNIFYSCI